MAINPQASPLQQYMATYGDRLKSMLPGAQPTTDPSSALGHTNQLTQGSGGSAFEAQVAQGNRQIQQGSADISALEDAQPRAQPQAAPQSALEEPAPAGGPASPMEEGAPAKKGTSFRDLWGQLSKEERESRTTELEKSLSKGKETINGAYDNLIKQMGTRPDEGLTKDEKAMMVIEFGLNLMKNSAGENYGTDFGGAMGDAGLKTLDRYQRTKGGKRRKYDSDVQTVEAARAKDLASLGEKSAVESIKADGLKGPRVQSTFAGEDNTQYALDSEGNAMPVRNAENGEPIKVRPPRDPVSALDRPNDFERKVKSYMDVHGVDADGNPLKGDELRRVKSAALEFAGDTRASTTSDAEMRSQAERSADEFMKANADMFRDMTPQQIAKYRDNLADERLERLRKGSMEADPDRSALEDRPKGPQGGRRPTKSAPDRAVERLRANPDAVDPGSGKTMKDLFKAKYGYLPAGM